MGPGTKLVSLGQVSWEEMHASYFEQARGLIAGGIDGFMIETSQDLLQQKIAINACIDALKEAGLTPDDRAIFSSVTIETTGTMLLGSDIAAVVNALKPFPIASLGLNIDPTTTMGSLPVGLQQLVELSRVLFSGAQIIILDEPTSALSPPEVKQKAVLERAKARFRERHRRAR